MGASRRWWALVAVLALAAGLRLATLDLYGFGLDELATATALRPAAGAMVGERMSSGHPPLYFLLAWALARAGGEIEWLLRLPAALAAVGAVLFLYLLVERLADRRSALLAAALLALSPASLALSQQARMYTLVQLLALAAAWWIVRAEASADEARTRWGPALGFGALAATALYVHYSAALVLAALLGHLLLRRRPHWRLATGGFAAAAAFTPWAVRVLQLDQRLQKPLHWAPPLSDLSLPLLLRQTLLRAELPAGSHWLALAWAALIGVLVLALAGSARLGRRGRLMVWLAAGPPAVALAVSAFATNLLAADRWYATSAAALLGLAAIGITGLGHCTVTGDEADSPPLPRRSRLTAALLLGASALGCVASLRTPQGRADWREMARLLDERIEPGERVLLLVDTPARRENLAYYWRGEIVVVGEGALPRAPPRGIWLGTTAGGSEPLAAASARLGPRARRDLYRLAAALPHQERFAIGAGTLFHWSRSVAPADPPSR